MKKVSDLLAALVLATATSAASAGVPVIDAANLVNSAQQVVAWAQQAKDMVDSINQMKAQVTQLENTFASMTGDRGLGTLLNLPADQANRRYLPPQADQIEQLASGQVPGYSRLQSAVASIRATISTLPKDTFAPGSDAEVALNAKLDSISTQKALGQAAYSSAERRTADVENLVVTIGSANDPKAIAEMQARIAAEQVLLQNEVAKVQAMAYMQRVEEQKTAQRAAELIGRWSKPTLPPFSME
jgi:type IV secretion system protein VirB5